MLATPNKKIMSPASGLGHKHAGSASQFSLRVCAPYLGVKRNLMGYSLHIEREESEISLEEWISAIKLIDGARILSEETKAVNPVTGVEIVISPNPGDVEVAFRSGGFLGFGKSETWESFIWYSRGRASFNATEDIESPDNTVHKVVAEAARLLSAKIVGDEGEQYSW